MKTTKTISKQRRIARVRARIHGTTERPRLCVRRSLKHLVAQIVDDQTGKTLVSCSDALVDLKGKKTDVAAAVGKMIAEQALAKKIVQVVFDRRERPYHGRVKAFAEGARSGGLQF